MTRSVDMRATVRTHVQGGNVRAVAPRQAFDRLEGEWRVIWVRREVRVERHRDVDELHEGAKSRMIA